jgi:transposase InsO family protein
MPLRLPSGTHSAHNRIQRIRRPVRAHQGRVLQEPTWPDFESFKADLEAYIVHWNTVRRQKRLGGLTPVEYGNQASEAAASC